jgi:hypothetical protein
LSDISDDRRYGPKRRCDAGSSRRDYDPLADLTSPAWPTASQRAGTNPPSEIHNMRRRKKA